jgi:hypothetical protein
VIVLDAVGAEDVREHPRDLPGGRRPGGQVGVLAGGHAFVADGVDRRAGGRRLALSPT